MKNSPRVTSGIASGIALSLAAVASLGTAGCSTLPPKAPTGAGVYHLTVADAATGRPVEGVAISAAGAGMRARGASPAGATTDEDGGATLAFGNWGTIDLVLSADGTEERWLVMQDRVAVNGGTSSREPLRMIVGSGRDGGSSRYALGITRVERGPRIDN